jgi:hypothetical protein
MFVEREDTTTGTIYKGIEICGEGVLYPHTAEWYTIRWWFDTFRYNGLIHIYKITWH